MQQSVCQNRINMSPEEYEDIAATIRSFKGLAKNCAKMLKEKYTNVPVNTLYSILSQEMERKMKFTSHRLLSQNKPYFDIYKEAKSGGEPVGILLRIAETIEVPPALLARFVLKKYCEMKDDDSKLNITKLLRDTTLIEEKDLAYEIYLCVLYDPHYGPIADTLGISIGQEYETALKTYVTERNIPFRDEEYLKSRGYDKTPDIKLEVPIAVNGFIVNWIESKARFGNVDVHNRYVKKQFLSYWNRFGPGLVIYWFGFIDTINRTSESKFLIVDNFPDNITYMEPGTFGALSL
ncbi:uncharacterized protein C15orf41 homolog [Orussus abietinus]|uniref:uncharacterized protein C15orf41 homolog n=1 Tax=Orussus abietinus TaxID=222816 RepID=UPI000625B3F2|nr:uncharacterized protein C15orf41 homolog [Orussus abietinus]